MALGLIPVPYETALNGQEGVTTETLGGFDDTRPQSQGGYDPGVRSCFSTWHSYHPKPIPGTESYYIEEQGPIQAWCGAIRLFATAAKNAGKDLNRRTFVEAMSKITNFPGTLSPVWSFGPSKFYGPTQYQVVKIHNNVPPSSQCKLKTNHKPQGTCWVTVQPFKPLPDRADGPRRGRSDARGTTRSAHLLTTLAVAREVGQAEAMEDAATPSAWGVTGSRAPTRARRARRPSTPPGTGPSPVGGGNERATSCSSSSSASSAASPSGRSRPPAGPRRRSRRSLPRPIPRIS